MEDIYVNLFWKCVCYTPSSLVTYCVMAKMLNISKRWRFMIGVTLLHILLTIATAVALDHGLPGADTMRVILQSAIYLGAAMLSSREPISRRLMAFGLCYLGTLFGEVGSIIVYSLLGGSVQAHGIADAMDHLSFYFFMQAVCFALLVVFLLVSLRIWERVILKSHRRVLWYFSLFPASQVVLISIAAYFATIDEFQVMRYYLLGGAVLFCVAADNFLFHAIGAFSERAISEERAGWFEHLLDQQQAYYDHILADQEDAAHIRHDIRNQLQTAYALVRSGDTEAAITQLDEISDALDQNPNYCANRVVNALLNVKAARFAEAEIPLQYSCEVPQYLPIPGVELCSLFSNILDNAFHACRNDASEHRGASISSGVQNGMLIVRCSNSYNPENQTPSAPGHGLGLDILRDLTRRRGGEMQIEQTDRRFDITIWLPLEGAVIS